MYPHFLSIWLIFIHFPFYTTFVYLDTKAEGVPFYHFGSFASEAAEAAGMKNAHWFESVEDLLPVIRELTAVGDTILVKASHAMGFERIIEALKQD